MQPPVAQLHYYLPFDVWKGGFRKTEDPFKLGNIKRTQASRWLLVCNNMDAKGTVMTVKGNENHSHPLKPDFDSEQLRAMVGRTEDTVRQTDAKPKGTPREKGRLTAKQRLFVSYIVQGMSHRDAYRHAYKPSTDNEATIAANAHRTASDPKVRALIDQSLAKTENALLQDELAMRRHVMGELLEHSKTMKGESQRLRALELMGKAVGMFTDRVEQTVEQISTESLKDELSKHLQLLDDVTKH
jgi:hypothetical protein